MQERLQKIIANAGIASRRAAEEMIVSGEVSINGRVITELGTKADPQRDHIKVRGKLINPRREEKPKRYYLVNKPKGYLSAVSDPKNRQLVAHLLPPSERRGLHPVGRLDFNTEGLIILTDDGDFTNQITQAGKVEKVYHVKVKGTPKGEQIEHLRQGIKLGEKRTAPAEIKLLARTSEGGNCWYEVKLIQGKNQQIRKMFDSIGHSVIKLRRTRIGHLTDEKLPPGEYREVTPSEVQKFFQSETTTKKINQRKGAGYRKPKENRGIVAKKVAHPRPDKRHPQQ